MALDSVLWIGLATALAFMSLGGAAYEFLVVDPYWPKRPEIVQPNRGGINRKRFWIPAHVGFELLLVVSLVLAWSEPTVRTLLLVALVSHVAMRVWSAFDFIPKALAFERADPSQLDSKTAVSW